MKKIYISDRLDFVEWKERHTNAHGNSLMEYDEREPRSYPCILLENDKYYGFVYLTDFIIDDGN